MKSQKENIINYAKIIGIYLVFALSAMLAISSFFLCLKSITSISYSDSNIDDRYGALNTNEKKVIEKNIINLMKEKRVNVYFSYVYKDINETYASKLYSGKNYIIFYYNKEKNSLKLISDIKDIEKFNFNYTVENDDIIISFQSTIKSIYKIDKQSNKLFFKNDTIAPLICIISIICTILFAIIFLCCISSDYIKKTLNKCKDNIRESSIKKEIEMQNNSEVDDNEETKEELFEINNEKINNENKEKSE